MNYLYMSSPVNMLQLKNIWSIIILFSLLSCAEEELSFTPTVDALYKNQFKVWSKTDIITDPATGKVISENETRDLNLQYIFSVDDIKVSNDGGDSFISYPDSYVSLDSIYYLDSGSGSRVSYFVHEVFRMKNGDPRTQSISNPRDNAYPELKGFYLFIELENKRKVEQEGGLLTEILTMYSEGYAE